MKKRDPEIFDVMAPIQREDGETIWMKIGIFTTQEQRSKGYVGTLSLLTLPVGAVAPLRLFVYPRKGAA